MRRHRILAVLALFGGACVGSEPSGEIFREISIRPHGIVRLGESFDPTDRPVREEMPGVFALPPGYGDTDGIVILLDEDGPVEAMVFHYPSAKDIYATLAAYTADLGQPLDSLVGADYRCWYWQDDLTLFQIQVSQPHGERVFSSVLADRGLITAPGCSIEMYEQVSQRRPGREN